MHIAKRPAERPSLQETVVFRGNTAEDLAGALTECLANNLVRVVSSTVINDGGAPKAKLALIVTLTED